MSHNAVWTLNKTLELLLLHHGTWAYSASQEINYLFSSWRWKWTIKLHQNNQLAKSKKSMNSLTLSQMTFFQSWNCLFLGNVLEMWLSTADCNLKLISSVFLFLLLGVSREQRRHRKVGVRVGWPSSDSHQGDHLCFWACAQPTVSQPWCKGVAVHLPRCTVLHLFAEEIHDT